MKRAFLALLACLLALPAAGDGFSRREGVATNLQFPSQSFTTRWGAINGTAANNIAVAPNGLTVGGRFLDDATADLHGISYFELFDPGANSTAQFTMSIYVKPITGARTWMRVFVRKNDNLAYFAWYNIVTGAIGTKGSGIDTIRAVKQRDGWVRLEVTWTEAGAGTNPTTDVSWLLTDADNSNTGYVGDGSDGFYMWGAQIQTGPRATHLVTTTTAAATRRAPGRMGADGFN